MEQTSYIYNLSQYHIKSFLQNLSCLMPTQIQMTSGIIITATQFLRAFGKKYSPRKYHNFVAMKIAALKSDQ